MARAAILPRPGLIQNTGRVWNWKVRVMTDITITEADSVQFPMVRHAAVRKRGGEAGMLFRAEVEEALERLNPWMTTAAIRATVEMLEALPPTIEGNCEMLAWLRSERQGYDETENRHRPVRLIVYGPLPLGTAVGREDRGLKGPASRSE